MNEYATSIKKLEEVFSKDCTFVLATIKNSVPSQRVVDTYYTDGAFWIVTYAKSNKVLEMREHEFVSLCNSFHIFHGKASFEGHPLEEKNKEIRDALIKAFEPWYFAHNNELDENMCFVKIVPLDGFFHKDGIGYRIDFKHEAADIFPFAPEISMASIE